MTVGALSSTSIYGQCLTNDLFPVRHGMTKFQAINTLNLQDNVYEVQDFLNYWSHPEYLEGDSVYDSQVNYKIMTHGCIKNYDNIVLMSFADQKLYEITLRIWFKPKDFDKCLENYNQVLESLKKEFPYYGGFISRNQENEQVGEGYWLHKSEEDKKKAKFEKVSVGYSIEYETKWSDYSKKMYKTGNIDKYLLEISYVNLEGTKLDRRGY
ncbi:MAG: hypothetical protein RIQ90_748 [Bacteroidota bacterium]